MAYGRVYGLWPIVYGLYPIVYGLWPLVYGLWPLVYGLWPIVYGLWPIVYGLYPSTDVVVEVDLVLEQSAATNPADSHRSRPAPSPIAKPPFCII